MEIARTARSKHRTQDDDDDIFSADIHTAVHNNENIFIKFYVLMDWRYVTVCLSI
jgi:hypothetical protein